jgi:hypothetical protein
VKNERIIPESGIQERLLDGLETFEIEVLMATARESTPDSLTNFTASSGWV